MVGLEKKHPYFQSSLRARNLSLISPLFLPLGMKTLIVTVSDLIYSSLLFWCHSAIQEASSLMSSNLKVPFASLEVGLIMTELPWAPGGMLWFHCNRKLPYLV